jgi:hypothetical protein
MKAVMEWVTAMEGEGSAVERGRVRKGEDYAS